MLVDWQCQSTRSRNKSSQEVEVVLRTKKWGKLSHARENFAWLNSKGIYKEKILTFVSLVKKRRTI